MSTKKCRTTVSPVAVTVLQNKVYPTSPSLKSDMFNEIWKFVTLADIVFSTVMVIFVTGGGGPTVAVDKLILADSAARRGLLFLTFN